MSNLVVNGEFETNTTGWTRVGSNTIAVSTTQAKFGSKSLLGTFQDNVLLCYYILTVAAAVRHVSSCQVWIPSAYDGDQISMVTTPAGTMGFTGVTVHSEEQADMTLRDQWQRISVTFTPAGGDLTGRVDISEDSAPTAGRFIYVDAVRCERTPVAVPHTALMR